MACSIDATDLGSRELMACSRELMACSRELMACSEDINIVCHVPPPQRDQSQNGYGLKLSANMLIYIRLFLVNQKRIMYCLDVSEGSTLFN